MMYTEADVRMREGGGQPDADNSGQGEGGLKITSFLRTSFMDGPLANIFFIQYIICTC